MDTEVLSSFTQLGAYYAASASSPSKTSLRRYSPVVTIFSSLRFFRHILYWYNLNPSACLHTQSVTVKTSHPRVCAILNMGSSEKLPFYLLFLFGHNLID